MQDHKHKCERCGDDFGSEEIHNLGAGWVLCDACYNVLYEDPDYASRITHEGQYEDETPVEYDVVALPDEIDSLALLVRTTAGLRVEIVADPFYLVATLDNKSVTVDIRPDQALDAFNHPALYLGAAGCEAIGLK